MLREASSTRHALTTLPALAPSGDSSGSARLADGPDSEEWIECLRIVRDIWMFAGEVISIKGKPMLQVPEQPPGRCAGSVRGPGQPDRIVRISLSDFFFSGTRASFMV